MGPASPFPPFAQGSTRQKVVLKGKFKKNQVFFLDNNLVSS